MFGLKSKNTPSGYVVVQTVMVGDDPDFYKTDATDRDAAIRIFEGVLHAAPEVFAPGTGNRLRVLTAEQWGVIEAQAEKLADVLLAESMGGPDDGEQS